MPTQAAAQAILAIWNDCAQGREGDYEQWYQGEHLRERLCINGFRIGRRYEALRAERQFLTTYEVDNAEVLTSADYLARLANPTERTEAMMKNGFCNASRTICTRGDMRGDMRAANVLTVSVDQRTPLGALTELARRYPVSARVAHTEIWTSAHPGGGQDSAETALRGPDAVIAGCLLVEFLRESDAIAAIDDARAAVRGATVGTYRLLSSLRREDVDCSLG